jgi:ribosomal protein S3AE
MIITNPKARRVMNSIIDNVGFSLSMPFFILAIIGGKMTGFIERKYKEIKMAMEK